MLAGYALPVKSLDSSDNNNKKKKFGPAQTMKNNNGLGIHHHRITIIEWVHWCIDGFGRAYKIPDYGDKKRRRMDQERMGFGIVATTKKNTYKRKPKSLNTAQLPGWQQTLLYIRQFGSPSVPHTFLSMFFFFQQKKNRASLVAFHVFVLIIDPFLFAQKSCRVLFCS